VWRFFNGLQSKSGRCVGSVQSAIFLIVAFAAIAPGVADDPIALAKPTRA
jgi:hypothetical protein